MAYRYICAASYSVSDQTYGLWRNGWRRVSPLFFFVCGGVGIIMAAPLDAFF
jgi:hypothetical protein